MRTLTIVAEVVADIIGASQRKRVFSTRPKTV